MSDDVIDRTLEAIERLADDDLTRALQLARTVTDNEAAATGLVMEARELVEALARTPEFRVAVERLAAALLVERELEREQIDALTRDVLPNHAGAGSEPE